MSDKNDKCRINFGFFSIEATGKPAEILAIAGAVATVGCAAYGVYRFAASVSNANSVSTK